MSRGERCGPDAGRIPVWALAGMAYAATLPLVVAGAAVCLLCRKAFGGALERMRQCLCFGWRPTEAYLAGLSPGGHRKQFPRK